MSEDYLSGTEILNGISYKRKIPLDPLKTSPNRSHLGPVPVMGRTVQRAAAGFDLSQYTGLTQVPTTGNLPGAHRYE